MPESPSSREDPGGHFSFGHQGLGGLSDADLDADAHSDMVPDSKSDMVPDFHSYGYINGDSDGDAYSDTDLDIYSLSYNFSLGDLRQLKTRV